MPYTPKGRGKQTNTVTALPEKGKTIKAFDVLLLESLDETLSDLFGSNTSRMIFEYLRCVISREEIPRQPSKFFALLADITGPKVAKIIGRAVARKLCAKLRWEYNENGAFEVADYVETAMARLRREQPANLSVNGEVNKTPPLNSPKIDATKVSIHDAIEEA